MWLKGLHDSCGWFKYILGHSVSIGLLKASGGGFHFVLADGACIRQEKKYWEDTLVSEASPLRPWHAITSGLPQIKISSTFTRTTPVVAYCSTLHCIWVHCIKLIFYFVLFYFSKK
jgi:hypothetical protein